jgi:VanZ family protein
MNHTERNIRICVILLILNLIFIWGNSMLPAEVSQKISDCVLELLPEIPEQPIQQGDGSHLVRKLAHVAEFTVLGMLLSWLTALHKRKWWLTVPLGTIVACIDETIQMFVPGRGPGLLDVGIDACGVLMGMLLLNTAYFLKRKQTNSFGG